MKQKKAQGLSMTVLVVAILALVILVILLLVLTGRLTLFGSNEIDSSEKIKPIEIDYSIDYSKAYDIWTECEEDNGCFFLSFETWSRFFGGDNFSCGLILVEGDSQLFWGYDCDNIRCYINYCDDDAHIQQELKKGNFTKYAIIKIMEHTYDSPRADFNMDNLLLSKCWFKTMQADENFEKSKLEILEECKKELNYYP